VTIPKGLQNIPRSAAADGPAGAAAEVRSGNGAADSSGNGTNGAANANQNAGNGSGNGQRPGTGSSGQSANSTSSNSRSGSASGRQGGGSTASAAGDRPNNPNGENPKNATNGNATNNGNGSNGQRPNPSAAPASPSPNAVSETPRTEVAARNPASSREVTRIQHPTNGSFDVVIMQSATRDDLPDLGGLLSGTPVYTVYLRVGDRKEWLLEYCVPAGQAAQSNPYEIKVDDAGAITPPYPIDTSIPNSILAASIPKHIVLRGMLTASGSIKSVRGADSNNPILPELVALLSEWRFRPALRDKKPIDVEILLVIPARV
jgi:hypothetical protein